MFIKCKCLIPINLQINDLDVLLIMEEALIYAFLLWNLGSPPRSFQPEMWHSR